MVVVGGARLCIALFSVGGSGCVTPCGTSRSERMTTLHAGRGVTELVSWSVDAVQVGDVPAVGANVCAVVEVRVRARAQVVAIPLEAQVAQHLVTRRLVPVMPRPGEVEIELGYRARPHPATVARDRRRLDQLVRTRVPGVVGSGRPRLAGAVHLIDLR